MKIQPGLTPPSKNTTIPTVVSRVGGLKETSAEPLAFQSALNMQSSGSYGDDDSAMDGDCSHVPSLTVLSNQLTNNIIKSTRGLFADMFEGLVSIGFDDKDKD